MITVSKLMIDYIKAQDSIEDFAGKLGVSRQTVYNIISGEKISNDMMTQLLKVSGFKMEKAFEVTEE